MHTMRIPMTVVFALAIAAGATAGHAAETAPAPAAEAAGAAPAGKKPAGPPKPWKDMTAKEKGKYMKKVIVPKMKPVFQKFDPKKFKVFNCATCHGKDPQEREFKMPSPAEAIHPLPSTPEAFQAKVKAEPTWPKWVDFMREKVSSPMAELLGLPAFDFKKPDPAAFSCKNCHQLEK